jgi:hypothetical protein
MRGGYTLESLRFEIPEMRIFVSVGSKWKDRISQKSYITERSSRRSKILINEQFTSDIKIRGGYAPESLRLEKPEARNPK